MAMDIIIKNLSKNYGGKRALNQVNLTITPGMFGLLGPNGAGKTTLMKILATLIPKSAGDVSICGLDISKGKDIRPMIGYLPQDFSMYGSMGAGEALDYLGVLSGIPRKERQERIASLLAQVNLEGEVRTKVRSMSGGMRRRLGIAQALLHDPKVLIVDEPTAGLDPEERIRFRNLLCETASSRIVILSTHIVGDIEATCENIGVLNEGELIFKGTVAELLKEAEGKMYTAEVSRMEIDRIKESYVVTSMVMQGSHAQIRFLAENPPFESARPSEVNVEDAYMYLMHGKRRGC